MVTQLPIIASVSNPSGLLHRKKNYKVIKETCEQHFYTSPKNCCSLARSWTQAFPHTADKMFTGTFLHPDLCTTFRAGGHSNTQWTCKAPSSVLLIWGKILPSISQHLAILYPSWENSKPGYLVIPREEKTTNWKLSNSMPKILILYPMHSNLKFFMYFIKMSHGGKIHICSTNGTSKPVGMKAVCTQQGLYCCHLAQCSYSPLPQRGITWRRDTWDWREASHTPKS